jgi:hypothetical protein
VTGGSRLAFEVPVIEGQAEAPMQFSPKLLKNWASFSSKKYSKNWIYCQYLLKSRHKAFDLSVTRLVEEQRGLLRTDYFSERRADLKFATGVSRYEVLHAGIVS